MFRRILVAMDGSDAARSAFVFVSDWARQFDSQVWFIQLTQESSRRRCEIVTDVGRRGRQLANHFTVSGATRSARNQRLVSGIAEAAETFRADLIVLGFEPGRIAHQRFEPERPRAVDRGDGCPGADRPPAHGAAAAAGRCSSRGGARSLSAPRTTTRTTRRLPWRARTGWYMFENVVVGATDSAASTRAVRRAIEVTRASGGTLHIVTASGSKRTRRADSSDRAA